MVVVVCVSEWVVAEPLVATITDKARKGDASSNRGGAANSPHDALIGSLAHRAKILRDDEGTRRMRP